MAASDKDLLVAQRSAASQRPLPETFPVADAAAARIDRRQDVSTVAADHFLLTPAQHLRATTIEGDNPAAGVDDDQALLVAGQRFELPETLG
jgi:hypothetical protein